MAETVAQPGWSFTVNPRKNPGSGVVNYTFLGPAGGTYEARLYGLRGTDTKQGYFADSDSYVNYSGAERPVTQVLTVAGDSVYSVVIYDLVNERAVLSYLEFPDWQVNNRVPRPSRVSTERSFYTDDDGNEMPFDFLAMGLIHHSFAFNRTANPDQLRWGELQPYNPMSVGTGFGHKRRGFVQVIDTAPPVETPARGETMNRKWGGIGGFLYIPSFPQLRRKETVWPDAT